MRLIATASGIFQQHRGEVPDDLTLFCTPGNVSAFFIPVFAPG
jgi:hypothetical protein